MEVAAFGPNYRPFLAQVVPPFTTRVSGGDNLAVQVGTTKDQGLYNMPSPAVHPGALAAGTLPQYNTYSRLFKDTTGGELPKKSFKCTEDGNES